MHRTHATTSKRFEPVADADSQGTVHGSLADDSGLDSDSDESCSEVCPPSSALIGDKQQAKASSWFDTPECYCVRRVVDLGLLVSQPLF